EERVRVRNYVLRLKVEGSHVPKARPTSKSNLIFCREVQGRQVRNLIEPVLYVFDSCVLAHNRRRYVQRWALVPIDICSRLLITWISARNDEFDTLNWPTSML
ncbi:MAG TPA: hypothetical protein VHS34_08120, partial [Terriglobales bacterium]|nr:hypothetical protein [Terriglobales bacterium]